MRYVVFLDLSALFLSGLMLFPMGYGSGSSEQMEIAIVCVNLLTVHCDVLGA